MLPKVTNFAVSHWIIDPYTLGGWSLIQPNGSPKTREFLGTVPFGGNDDGRILLAGEYTNPTDSGMVHGAYLSGVRAGRWCLSKMNNNNNNNNIQNVVIIGAGAAGIGCAETLLREKVKQKQSDNHKNKIGNVIVLEARGRIGGRVHTVSLLKKDNTSNDNNNTNINNTFHNFAVELGANWIQQAHERNPLYSLAKINYNLKLVETDFNSPMEYPTNKAVASTRVEQIMNQFHKRRKQQQKIIDDDGGDKNENRREEDNTSIQQVLDIWLEEIRNKKNVKKDNDDDNNNIFTNEEEEEINEILHVIEGQLCIDTGVPLSQLSSSYGVEPGVGDGDYWVAGGYNQILNNIVKENDIHVQLNCPVKRIKWDEKQQQIIIQIQKATSTNSNNGDNGNNNGSVQQEEGQERVIKTDLMICTIPVEVLKSSDFNIFNSDDNDMCLLPSQHKEAINLLITGKVEKVVLQFEKRWWYNSNNNDNSVRSSSYIRVHGNEFGDVSEWLDLTETYGVPIISGIFSGPWVNEIWGYNDNNNQIRTDEDVALKTTEVLYKAIFNSINNNK